MVREAGGEVLGVDVGGTFTDAVLLRRGAMRSAKVPTTPEDPARGVLAAIDALLADAQGGAEGVERFAHGMTVATNALLEGAGARTALVATEGFTDLVELGRQARPHLYRLCEARPAPMAPPALRFGAPERMGPRGPLRALDREGARALAGRLAEAQVEGVAVALLHSYAHPEHERALGELIRERLPGVHVSLSHELVGTFREYERAASTEVDAALSPLLAGYLGRLAEACAKRGLRAPQVMQSSGGLAEAAKAAGHAALTVLSGPAGGVAGALALARLAGEQNVLCLDMGGTSCDVCLIEGGRVAETSERSIAGRPLALPALDIHTVGAGGGSIAWRDSGGALRVGPRSAGALPGPACYGQGGEEPTVTDANLLLGRLPAETELAGRVRLDRGAAERAIGSIAGRLGLEAPACAAGIVRVAEAEMLRALRVMTVERGIDPRGFTLMAFGGAGGLHAANMAEELGMSRVLCPRASGVLCALGLALAPPRHDVARTVMLAGPELTAARIGAERDALIARARAGLGTAGARVRVRYELRYQGQSFELAVEQSESADPELIADAFAVEHERRYGYRDEDSEVELVTIRVSLVGDSPAGLGAAASPPRTGRGAQPSAGGAGHAGHAGPASIALPEATVYVPEGWSGVVDADGAVHMARPGQRRGAAGGAAHEEGPERAREAGVRAGGGPSPPGGRVDPIELRVLTGGLRAACEEMGATLVRAAHSANIKERRDASTALFDADGQMVMQAEHIPVHLGALPDAVAAVLGERQREGRSWILNDPWAGGTHLPDITLITPVFEGARLLGFAVSRAHHADVGGRWPGSMPADSRRIEEEGVVIAPQLVDERTIEALVSRMRGRAERRADLRAQLAANRVGEHRLRELAGRVGARRLRTATDAVLDYAERRTRVALEELGARKGSVLCAEDRLEAVEGDLLLRLRATLSAGGLTLDFTGSAEQHAGNLNCPIAVTRSACLFGVRVLTDPDIPPCAGGWRPIELRVPEGSVLNARAGAAVAAGNVETSSRVADLVLGAFGCALGQGTMNNMTLGNERFTYYETTGGGQGACPDADGPNAVHVAMSNTLNTPIEALEGSLPVRVRRYEVRRGSGGEGARRGGDGVVREIEALEEMQLSLITERRRHAPRGAAGGGPGKRGRNVLIRARAGDGDGPGRAEEELPGKVTATLRRGERVRLETPGGGGFGTGAGTPSGETIAGR
jgi:N-methylhydantoinase A/oxoprolinase/acetone carboxylase beta subunit/N-methylhydantoinase B/oxoprolinase/acetone carboxylase alpha subunit